MVFSSSVIFGGPGGCSARKWKTLPFSNGFHLWSSEILVVVLQEMVGNEQNGRHGIIDKGAAKPGFCNSKMFFQNHFHTSLKSRETRLLPFQDGFFWNIISTRLKSRAAAVLENHCYLLKSSHLAAATIQDAVWIYNDFHPHSTKHLLQFKDLFVNDFSCQNL